MSTGRQGRTVAGEARGLRAVHRRSVERLLRLVRIAAAVEIHELVLRDAELPSLARGHEDARCALVDVCAQGYH